MLQETKLDESFPMRQFSVEGYNVYRTGYTGRGGGDKLSLNINKKLDVFPQRALSGWL